MTPAGKLHRVTDHDYPDLRKYSSCAKLLFWYTFLFAFFYVIIFSPFWVYGKAYLWYNDGMTQHLPALLYMHKWVRSFASNLLSGKLDFTFWSLELGFGQNTLFHAVNFRFINFLYAFFPIDSFESYSVFKTVCLLYLCGLSFMAYARTRVKYNDTSVLLGCMVYVFSAFSFFFAARHTFFLEMMFFFPLMVLGVDQIFEKGRSWLFILVVFLEGVSYFYFLYMITLPAVIYAVFHYFELSRTTREEYGGLIRIFLRHVFHYMAGILLAAFALLPNIIMVLNSSRTSFSSGTSLWHWDLSVYMDYLRGLVGVQQIGIYGFIALSSISVFALLCLIYKKGKKDIWLKAQILFYFLVFLVPVLTMLFNGLGGMTQRWCFLLSFWVAIAVTTVQISNDFIDKKGFTFAVCAYSAYVVLYLVVVIWRNNTISPSILLVFFGLFVYYCIFFFDSLKKRRKLATALLFGILLVEMTVKSYELYAPQYNNYINEYGNSGTVLQVAKDNAASALEMVSDDSLFRIDVVTNPRSRKYNQINYGLRNEVNGLSSYFSYSDRRIIDYSLDLGNSQINNKFLILDLDQRTVLDELAGVKYLATLDKTRRLPYGYELVDLRDKTLSDGTQTTEVLYENKYALPLAYTYTSYIPYDVYDELSPNRKEQAMLQGVVLETDVGIEETELAFDDKVLLGRKKIMAKLAKIAKTDDSFEMIDGGVRVKKSNYRVTIPLSDIDTSLTENGETYLLFRNMEYRSFNLSLEQVEQLKQQENTPRLSIVNAERTARHWSPTQTGVVTVSYDGATDDSTLLAKGQQYYFGPKDMLLNLGCGRKGKELTITFSAAGEYVFDDVKLIVQPMDKYVDRVKRLQANPTTVEISGNTVTVDWQINEPSVGCLAIPYSGDWSVKVDGKKAKLLPVNGMYMGVYLTEGNHTVIFTNRLRGLTLGLVISLATFNVLLVLWVRRRRQMQKSRPRTQPRTKPGFDQTKIKTT